MNYKDFHIGVLGGGSWGTALVKVVSSNTENLHWWVRNKDIVENIKAYGKNPSYLRYADLPKTIDVSIDINNVIRQSDILIVAIPSPFIKDAVLRVNRHMLAEKKVFSAVKGIIPGEISTVTELLKIHFSVPSQNLGVISGPCHSEEVAMEKYSFLTIGSYNMELAVEMQRLLTSRFMKISLSDDVRGIEYASILKNIIAIASGISHGLGYGDNFQAVLIANAVQEMKALLGKIESNGRNLAHSVYLGDVMVTAYSKFSRNRMLGNLLGKGYSVKASLTEMNMIAEGYYAVDSVMKIAEDKKLNMPVMKAVYNILYNNACAAEQVRLLASVLK
ncbi:MAG: NAD(P)H-dependent glycerol-3-phosphate dehydrogenase [Bacteroidales bacterium]